MIDFTIAEGEPRPTHFDGTQNINDNMDICQGRESPSDPALLEPGEVAASWFNLDWSIMDGKQQTQRIKTRVDSQCAWSMIQSSTVESLGLKQRPLLVKKEFEGIFGGIEVATRYVEMYISCPDIGQEVVKWPACVVTAPGLDGLLLGSNFDGKHGVFAKIVDAKKRNVIPPGANAGSSMATNGNSVAAVLDPRSKASKKKDQETNKLNSPGAHSTVNNILAAKGVAPSFSPASTSSSGMSTWTSTTSTYSGFDSAASTTATSMSWSGSSTSKSHNTGNGN